MVIILGLENCLISDLKSLMSAISNLISVLYNLQENINSYSNRMKLSRSIQQKTPSHSHDDSYAQPSQSKLNETVLNKFITYMTQLRNNQLREGVNNIYGRHYAVNFNPKYQFKQQWESKAKLNQQNNTCEIIQSELPIAYTYSIILLIFQLFLVWYYSTFRLIGLIKEQLTSTILVISIIITFIDMFIKFFIKFIKTATVIEWRDAIMLFKDSQALLLYYFLNLIMVKLQIYENQNAIMYILDVVAIRLLYGRTKRLFQHFKIRSYTTAYKHYFKILDLASNILSIQHIFAILIYIVSYYDQNNNFLAHYGHTDVTNFQRYYYSFYFTSTTIFTIGYGDIVPINNMEIFCVLIMQMLGIANFSYLINQIGYTLSTIRKEQEELEHNISALSKMCKYYKIEPELANIAKDYLLNNQKSFHDIEPQEQNQVLMKLNDNLRQALTYENSLNIVKSSLFFICHWTKLFQTEIAKKLVKKILIPNEMIIQVSGKENIFIIKSGKLEVYTNNCIGFRKSFKKLVKTIQPNANSQICDNIYGYTSIISTRQVKLNAISKDFTCVYYIDKHSFMECVHESKLDTQYFFQIKENLNQSKIVQAYEAPAVLNIRQHYRPSETFIIKKCVQRMKKFRNARKSYQRYSRSIMVNKNIVMTYKDGGVDRCASTSKEIRLTIYDFRSSFNIPTNRCSLGENQNPIIPKEEEASKQMIMTSYFEAMKDYQRYFKRFNICNILLKLQKENLADQHQRDPQSQIKVQSLINRASAYTKTYRSNHL